MTKRFIGVLLVFGTLLLRALPCWAQTEPVERASAAACKLLASTEFSSIKEAPTKIVSTEFVEPKDGVPGYCDVRGYVWPQVGIDLQLPVTGWKGRFIEMGCNGGGACGTLPTGRWCQLDGYACITSDMGHQGGLLDGLWADNNLQTQVDFGYRGPHVAAVAGKAITERYYGTPPQHSYFMGGSTGARHALVEAQRFPWDFDGIIALAPWIDDTASTMSQAWGVMTLKGADEKSILSRADMKVVNEAALAQCAGDDGVKDGLISNPLTCQFDPATLVCQAGKTTGCVTAAQAEAVKKMYAGPTNSKGEKTFVRGVMPGSELEWEIIVGSAIEAWATEYFRHMIMPALGPSWKLTDFDFDRDYKRLGSTSESLLNATNPDLRKFKAAGGKLIIVQGWNDPLGAIPERTIDYYETVERTMGGRATTQDFFRLFMVPGMGHGCYGDGACIIDYLSYIEAWVEHGKAPDRIIGAHVSDAYLAAQASKLEVPADMAGIPGIRKAFAIGQLRLPLDPAIPVAFTRPIYPYPIEAKYKGIGDPNQADSFVPVASIKRKIAPR